MDATIQAAQTPAPTSRTLEADVPLAQSASALSPTLHIPSSATTRGPLGNTPQRAHYRQQPRVQEELGVGHPHGQEQLSLIRPLIR